MKLSRKGSYIRTEILKRNLDFCKDITLEQMETILSLADYYDAKEKNTQLLLVIELENESSVPKVFYRGEEVARKINVSFDWDTADSYSPGGLSYAVEHIESNSKQLATNRVERKFRSHATN